MIWLRLHTRIRRDRQLQTMPADLFRHLVNIWTLVKDNNQAGELPSLDDIAFELRLSNDETLAILGELCKMTLLMEKKGRFSVKNWTKWQSGDDSKNRVAKFRNGKRNGIGNGECNGNGNDSSNGTDDRDSNNFGNDGNAHREREEREREREAHTPVEIWVEKLIELHPKPCEPRYVATFCSDNWHRLGEDESRFAEYMTVVHTGLIGWCKHWEASGSTYAMSLEKWLNGGGWKKNPPTQSSQQSIFGGKQSSNDDLPVFTMADVRRKEAERAAADAEYDRIHGAQGEATV